MLKAIRQLLRPLATQVANLVARGVVRLADDSAKLQLLQVTVGPGETRDRLEHLQAYGFTSVPLAGAEVVVLFPGGRRDHGLVVASGDRRHRLAGLQPGEVALYTDEGDAIVLKRGSLIEIGRGGPTQPAALATALRTELDAIWTALGAHVHPGVTAGGATTGPSPVPPSPQVIASAHVTVRT